MRPQTIAELLIELLGDDPADPGRKKAARELSIRWNDAKSLLKAALREAIAVRDKTEPYDY